MATTLRLVDRVDGADHVVDLALEGRGARRTAQARFDFRLSARDWEDMRWYLEEYLQYPVDPAPQIAAGVEARLARLGADLFRRVLEANRDTMRLWDAVEGSLSAARIEVATGAEQAAGIPWELLRDPATDGVLAVRAGAFVRALAESAAPVTASAAHETLRVLLVICRPGGGEDVPFRSVASHLVRLSQKAREAFQLDVLRPPTYGKLTQVLQAARAKGAPYHVVHFDGHGAWLDDDAVSAGRVGRFDQQRFSVLSPPRPGSHGYLAFEDPSVEENQQLVDGPALGQLLTDSEVPVLVLNACRSAHAGLATEPEHGAGAGLDAHGRVRAYGSLAQEVMDAGVAGVVAMAYNVYVVTAAKFIGQVYAALLEGQPLGAAVTAARRQLAADPQRQIGARPLPLQDWMVPVVYEATPLALRPAQLVSRKLSIDLSQAEAGAERAGLEPGLPGGPDAGFFGRDETLLALDRAFDSAQAVLLHAWAGAGKTSTALEFARWYALTGGTAAVLFSSFEHHLTLVRLLDQIGTQFGTALEASGVQWTTLGDAARRDVALQVLAQVPVLWVWDNIEPVTGFPAGAPSAWTGAEQAELLAFLRDLATRTQCKVLLTSRRDERAWLGDLPARVTLPPMPMLERLELAQAIARRQTGGTQAFLAVEDWRPLLSFTQGNPLTVTILTRQAIRGHHVTRQQLEEFVAALRAGAATVTDDAAQGRDASLAASLDYGFTQAFTEDERAILALLALFQGFIDVDALTALGSPALPRGPVREVTGLNREAATALLDRAAEVGLLTSYGGGYYAVHPAIPWHLHALFERYYGPPDSPPARQAMHAWTADMAAIGAYYYGHYTAGRSNVIGVLRMEEPNLLQGRQLALSHGWLESVLGAMQGLQCLYQHTGRAVEWRRLVAELVPVFTDPANGGPRPGLEQDWALLTGYQAAIAQEARDWETAKRLQSTRVAWERRQGADALAVRPEELDTSQRGRIYSLAGALGLLGQILQDMDDSGCVPAYEEAIKLYQRIGARREEGIGAFNLGTAYKNMPALRDLDQAQRWYERGLDLTDESDVLGRAKTIGQLGTVAFDRFLEARAARADDETQLGYLNDAARTYYEVLELIPDDSIEDLAVVHGKLGIVYSEAGDVDRALGHYQKGIHYHELQDNAYNAGVIRFNVAVVLAKAGRTYDALLYARAALRDFEALGPGAAGNVARTQGMISRFEKELAGEPGPGPGSP